MVSRTRILKHGLPLARALPGAQFAEYHERVIDAPAEDVWASFHRLAWNELRVTKPLTLLRGMGGGLADRLVIDPPSPVAPIHEDPPTYSMGAEISKPWQIRPQEGPQCRDLDEFAAFVEPGWVKFGADWRFEVLPGERTRLSTTTLCEATDASARRKFGVYWIGIRLGSGLIRRDLLAAIDRRAVRMRSA